VVSKEDYGMWKLNPVTQSFMSTIRELISDGIDELGSGQHSLDLGKTYLIVGKLNAYNSVLKTDFTEE